MRVLDAGCGMGADLPALRERFAEASVLGVDLSAAMLARARISRIGGIGSQRRLAALSAGHAWQGLRRARPATRAGAISAELPFAAGAFEMLWSNLALHWHSRPDLVFPEWQRVLKVNGLLMFSTLGPDTLQELSGAYAQAEKSRWA